MIHGWDGLQWALYHCTQYGATLAYFVIPYTWVFFFRLAQQGQQEYVAAARSDLLINAAFVFFCGLHHLTHPAFMQLNWFWPMMIVDIPMSVMSVLASRRAWALYRQFAHLVPRLTLRELVRILRDGA